MSGSTTLTEIESAITRLSRADRLWLIERLAHGLRHGSNDSRFDAALAEMAADPEIRQELGQIASEFAPAEMDGLE